MILRPGSKFCPNFLPDLHGCHLKVFGFTVRDLFRGGVVVEVLYQPLSTESSRRELFLQFPWFVGPHSAVSHSDGFPGGTRNVRTLPVTVPVLRSQVETGRRGFN